MLLAYKIKNRKLTLEVSRKESSFMFNQVSLLIHQKYTNHWLCIRHCTTLGTEERELNKIVMCLPLFLSESNRGRCRGNVYEIVPKALM